MEFCNDLSLTLNPLVIKSYAVGGTPIQNSVATAENISNLENTLLSRFDELSKELLNVKDVIIKNLQAENERLRDKVSNLESKVVSLKINQNMLEQYGRRNNIEVSGILDSVGDNDLEEKVISVFANIGIDVKSNDIEACHRIGKSRNSSKKQLSGLLIESSPSKHFIIGKS